MESLKKSGILNYDDVPVKTKSGQELYTDIYMVDRAKLAQCNIRDVTERKLADKILKEEKSFIENAMNTLQDIFIVFNLEGRFIRWNKTMNAVTGYTDSEIALMTVIDFFRKDDIRRITEAIQEVFKEGSVNIEAIGVTKDGRQIPYEWNAALLKDAHDNPIGVSGVGRDISERKKAEAALRESEVRFRQIAESAKAWIWEVNSDGLYTYSSQVVEEILGYTPEEVVGKMHLYDFIPDEKREQINKEVLASFANKSAFAKYVKSNVHKNGSIVLLETSSTPVLNSSGDLLGYRGVDVDITEHQKLEAQLRHAQKMEAIGTLAGGIAHDFNNILNVIMGYGALAIENLEAGSPSKKDMNEVLIAADRAANLTKRLLVFSRKQVVEVKPVNINELILGIQKMLVRIISERIEFSLDLADRPLIVLADAGQIEQVLINLIVNAKDVMLEGGRLTIGTGLEEVDEAYVAAYGYGKPGRYVLITVADTGHGMDVETQKKIFEPFFTTKSIGEGTGLGLAIAYGIIKQHSGYIQVYSEPGQGTEFKIYLPVREETALQDKKPDAAFSVKGGNETVLVAEDDAGLRTLTKIILESFGYSVISAEDGEDAVTKFMENRERISLILLDMIMPKKNGKEVGEAIRKISPRIKILLTSGYTMDIIKTKELAEADFDFLHKPFQSKDLLIKVRGILDR
jgi:PAS domain S-box-containing protein